MSASKWRCLAGLAGLIGALLMAAAASAETKPPATPGGRGAPPPKGVKWEGPDFDAAKGRTPAKGRGFYSLPEKEDEVLLLRNRKGSR